MKDLDAAYSSKICEYCGRYKSVNHFSDRNIFYCRGRKKRWVTTCHDCATEVEAIAICQ
jgi:hypothetical protein